MTINLLKVFVFIAFSINCVDLSAQMKNISKAKIYSHLQFESSEENIKSADFFDHKSNQMGIGTDDHMILVMEMPGKNNYTYKKYEQSYKGVPVFGSAYTLRVQDGNVKRATGYYLPYIDMEVIPKISSDKAFQFAMQKMNAKKYSWQDEGLTKIPGYTEKPTATLMIIDEAFPNTSENYKLVYQVDLQSVEPVDKKRFFIDAYTGEALLDLPLMMHQAVPGSGLTKYYGEQNFTVDSVAPGQYVLLDPSRGNGNAVFNSNGEMFTDSDNFWDLFNEDQDEVAVDAHYCTERFHDMMLNVFNWDGLDNQGGSMNSVIHAGDLVNAFWDGKSAFFADGDCNHGPLTTLEVVGHEFMHGITDNTSKLVYSSESGAINESISDVFGKALEFIEAPDDFEWTIGDSFLETQYGTPLRSFIDPNVREHPKLYKGEFWSDSNSAVHTNSSVGNYWYYLLVNGGADTNELGVAFDVEGIGMDKALEIVYLTQSTLLVPSTNYAFYLQSSLIAAEELFGRDSDEALAVVEAWKAVGVTNVEEEVFGLVLTTEQDLQTCLNNENIELEFTISNLSSVAYLPSMEGRFRLFYFDYEAYTSDESIVTIDEEILPGESISFTVDDFLFIGTQEAIFLSASVNVETEDIDFSQSQFIFITNSIYANDDLGLVSNNFGVTPASACINSNVELNFDVTNFSCEPVESGTSFILDFYNSNDEIVMTRSYTLPFDLLRNGIFPITENVDIIILDSDISRVELVYEDDPNELSNFIDINLSEPDVIDFEYDQTFDDAELDGLYLSRADEFQVETSFSYQNDNYFAATGRVNSLGFGLCPEVEDLFKSDRVTLDMCIDTKDMSDPNVSFDLIQFRGLGNVEFFELAENSNVVKVSWTDGQNDFEEYIVGQTEGQLRNHLFNLPSDSKGVLEFDFFNKAGNLGFMNFFSTDVTFMDNLTIIGGEVTSVEETENNDFEVQPNPTTGLFRLSYPDTPDALILTNVHGQEVLNITPDKSTHELDISHLPNGNYAITLIYPEGISSSIIVKIGG